MVRYQEVIIKSQKEKEYRRFKAWSKLPRIQQNTILLVGIDPKENIPTEATEEMMSILGYQNGAQVEQLDPHSMNTTCISNQDYVPP